MSTISSVNGADSPQHNVEIHQEQGDLHHVLQDAAPLVSMATQAQGMPVSPPPVRAHIAEEPLSTLNALTESVAQAQKAGMEQVSAEQEVAVPLALQVAMRTVLDDVEQILDAKAQQSGESHVPRDVKNLLEEMHHLAGEFSKIEGMESLALHLLESAQTLADMSSDSKALLQVLENALQESATLPAQQQVQECGTLWSEILDEQGQGTVGDAVGATAQEQGPALAGPAMLPEDLAALQSAVGSHIAKALTQIPAPDSSDSSDPKPHAWLNELTAETRVSLGFLAQETKLNITELIDILKNAGLNVPKDGRAEYVGIMLQGIRESKLPAEKLQYVDTLLQGGYPERADAALLFKEALLPDTGLRKGVEAQHSLMLSFRSMAAKLEAAHGGGRHKTLERASGPQNAPSLLLTPQFVASLKAKGLPKVNYYLAHLVALQATAIEHDLVNMSYAQDDERAMLSNLAEPDTLKGWCTALGMDAEEAAYASKVRAHVHDPEDGHEFLNALQDACRHFEQQGLGGSADAAKAAGIVRAVGKMSTHVHSASSESSLYSTNPQYVARLAMDREIIALTGLVKNESRLENEKTGLAPKGEEIDSLIKNSVHRALGGDDTQKRRALLGKQHGALGEQDAMQALNTDLKDFIKNVKIATRIAGESRDIIATRSAMNEAQALTAQNRGVRKYTGFAWPHQRAQRQEICQALLEFREIDAHLTVIQSHMAQLNVPLAEGASEGEKASREASIAIMDERSKVLQARSDGLLKQLATVDPHKLVMTKKPNNYSVKDVRERMVPLAEALNFFASGTAKRLSQEIRSKSVQLRSQRLTEHKLAVAAKKSFGPGNLHILQSAARAALLKVFTESGESGSDFSITAHDKKWYGAVLQQLHTWGMTEINESRVLRDVVNQALYKVTHSDGTLNTADLRHLATKQAVHTVWGQKVMEGESVVAARRHARSIVLQGAKGASRQEGISMLMDGVSRPGGGFVYDKTKGIVVDTSALFSPVRGNILPTSSLRFPLNARFQYLHSDSLAVLKTQTGYQVLLKTKHAAALSASYRVSLKAGFGVSVSGGVEANRAAGLALDFQDRAACERFLHDFMVPDSDLHEKVITQARWMQDAAQIRFLDSKGFSINAALGVSHNLLNEQIAGSIGLNVLASATVSASGEWESATEYNALGETATLSRKYNVTLAAAVSTGIVNSRNVQGTDIDRMQKTNINKMGLRAALDIGMTQRFKVVTGERGLMPATCMEMECPRANVPDLQFLRLLPASVRESILKDPALSDTLYKAGKDLRPTARLILHYDIKPDKLEEAQTLMIQTRHAQGRQKEEYLAAAQKLLASGDSYLPTRIILQEMVNQGLGHNFSPGFGPVKFVHTNSKTDSTNTVIPLPPPLDA